MKNDYKENKEKFIFVFFSVYLFRNEIDENENKGFFKRDKVRLLRIVQALLSKI